MTKGNDLIPHPLFSHLV